MPVELIIRKTRENRPYRLKCRLKIEPHPRRDRLDREKVRIAEWFVVDMHKQRWEHDGRYGFTMKGPFPRAEVVTLHPKRLLTAQEMAPQVARGARFLDSAESGVMDVPPLALSEYWEYEIAGVFVRPQIMTEYPDLHEEEH